MALPLLAGVVRVIGAGLTRVGARSVVALTSALRRGGLQLSRQYARAIALFGRTAATTFKPKSGKPIVNVNVSKALRKIDSIEPIIEDVMEDALVQMKSHTAKVKGNARNNTKLKNKTTLTADYEYAQYLDRPNFQKSNVSIQGRKQGFSKPTEEYIIKEIKSRIKRQLGK
jgi:hypothetical protein